jgi:hypothetical protein
LREHQGIWGRHRPPPSAWWLRREGRGRGEEWGNGKDRGLSAKKCIGKGASRAAHMTYGP